jgi:hypothetical protein
MKNQHLGKMRSALMLLMFVAAQAHFAARAETSPPPPPPADRSTPRSNPDCRLAFRLTTAGNRRLYSAPLASFTPPLITAREKGEFSPPPLFGLLVVSPGRVCRPAKPENR